jgi:autotransporter-associated beta strand protein
MSRHRRRFVLVLLVAGLAPAAATPQSGSWNANTAGTYNWSLAGDWLNGIVADGADNTATFATAGLSGDITVNLDSARTIGVLVFDNPTNTFGWTIQGGNSLTLSNAGGPTIAVNNASITATIATPLAGSFTKTGPGTLALTGNNNGLTGGVTVSAGVLAAKLGSLGTGPVTLAGGTLAVGPKLVLDGFGGIANTSTAFNYDSNLWQLNGAGSFPSPNVFQVTPATGGSTSLWNKSQVSIAAPFTIKYTLTNLIAAGSGLTVGFQKAGNTAIGSGIPPGIGLAMNAGGSGSGIAVYINGTITNPFSPTAPVNFGTQNNPTNFTLSWDGTNLDVRLVQGSNSYDSGPLPMDILGTVGTSAYFGFTGSTGGVLSQTQISNFSYTSPGYNTPLVPLPGSYANNVVVTSSSTIQVTAPSGAPTVTMGKLTMAAGTTLTVSPDPANPAGSPFGLTFTGTTLNGPATLNVPNNAAGIGTLSLGPLTDFSGKSAITMTGGGNLAVTGGTLGGRLNLGTGNLSMTGTSFAVGSLAGTGGTLSGNGTTTITLTMGSDNTDSAYAGNIVNGSTGAVSIVKTGSGTQSLSGANTYSGGTSINNGTLAVPADTTLGTGAVTIAPLGTLAYTANTTTTRTFSLGGGSLAAAAGATVTLNGNTVSGGFLGGPGTFSTDAKNGARFANGTSQASATINSNSGTDRFVNFTNYGAVNIAANIGSATPVTLNSVTNSGSITIGANTVVNATNFQSYGVMVIAPGTGGAMTQLVNPGTSSLFFSGGSRTQIGDPRQAPLLNAGIDLRGHDLNIAGGLFVNDGFIIDSSGSGTAQVVADAGSLVKGNSAPLMTTVNGGKFQAGDPIGLSHGPTVFGPNGMTNFVFDIDDATGTAGPAPDAAGHVSGWSTITEDSRGFTWAGAWNIHLQTLLNPATVGTNGVEGPMDHFDPSKPYSWLFAQWVGTYNGPTDPTTLSAQTGFDTSGFANPITGSFGWQLDLAGKTLSLTYTPTAAPEPGTLALVAAAAGGWLVWRRNKKSP